MRLDMSQNIRMIQTMAPRMIQSMEILQLPVLALEERIREEMAENAALELEASAVERTSTDLEAKYDTASEPGETGIPVIDERRHKDEGPSPQEIDAFSQLAQEWSENYTPDHHPSRWAGMELSDKKQDAMLNMADRPPSLESSLLDQLSLDFSDEPAIVLEFAQHIIANLDERGFLPTTIEEISKSFEKKISEAQKSRALYLVQHLEPAGIGARDLRECLMIQLADPPPCVEHAELLRVIVGNHLDDLRNNRLPVIERKTGVPLQTLREAIRELRFLNLNPGAEFAQTTTQYVVPDVVVEPDEDGNYQVRLNEENTPSVHISRHYLEMLRDKKEDPEALNYLKKKITAARWLIDSIEQRRATLEKVTRAIIDHQRDFLEKGPEYIEPLKMATIAERIGVHVTTVSRAVDDKWVQTHRGIFPLRSFFGGGTVTDDGKDVAYDTIKRKLTELVHSEEKTNPYSDDELVKKLAEMGYPLARRTVTKYRKMLGILSSRQRKQHV